MPCKGGKITVRVSNIQRITSVKSATYVHIVESKYHKLKPVYLM